VKVALVEHAEIIILQGTSHGVHETTVVEQDEIVLAPIVGVDELVGNLLSERW
jgi:hypothetical protein